MWRCSPQERGDRATSTTALRPCSSRHPETGPFHRIWGREREPIRETEYLVNIFPKKQMCVECGKMKHTRLTRLYLTTISGHLWTSWFPPCRVTAAPHKMDDWRQKDDMRSNQHTIWLSSSSVLLNIPCVILICVFLSWYHLSCRALGGLCIWAKGGWNGCWAFPRSPLLTVEEVKAAVSQELIHHLQ